MKERLCIAGFLIAAMMASTSSAQIVNKVAQLGRMPVNGKVKQVGLLAKFFGHGSSAAGCDGCADPACGVPDPTCGCEAPVPDCGCAAPAPSCGCEVAPPTCDAPACGLPEPACGAPGMPSCGMAGGILGKLGGRFGGLRGMLGGLGGGGACGCETMEPECGVTGLGYSGGFGLCGGCGGGSCDSCGVGGYFGRNIHKVDPCACGGSLFGDASRNFLSFFDQAVGTLAGSFVGGLRAAGGHARGSLAAMHSAKKCGGCADIGCDSCSAPVGLAPGGCALGVCGDPLGCGTGCDAGCDSGCAAPVAGGYMAAPMESAPAASYPVESYPATAPVETYSSPAGTPDDIYLPPPAPPVMSAPMEGTPIETMPMEPNMIEAAPVDAQPIDSIPVETAPIEPVESAPLDTSPIDSSPIDTSPLDSSPINDLPGLDPIDTTPLETTPIQGIDPFIDDPAPLSRRQPQQRAVAGGYRVFNGGNPFRQRANSPQRVGGYQFAPQRVAKQPTAPQRMTAAANRSVNLVTGMRSVGQAGTGKVQQAVSQVRSLEQGNQAKRYLQARGHQATMRR